MTKRALALLYEALKPIDAKIVNSICDEIVIEAAREFIRSLPVPVDVAIADARLK
jgi:hypothetical protein